MSDVVNDRYLVKYPLMSEGNSITSQYTQSIVYHGERRKEFFVAFLAESYHHCVPCTKLTKSVTVIIDQRLNEGDRNLSNLMELCLLVSI